MRYKDRIFELLKKHPMYDKIDLDIVKNGNPPSQANSEFLTNNEQGVWAEDLVFNAINSLSSEYIAVHYGKNDKIAAGDPGFSEFYKKYQEEQNTIGKRPDILIFKKKDFSAEVLEDFSNVELVSKAIAAIEVRSSSYLIEKYREEGNLTYARALENCKRLVADIVNSPCGDFIKNKKPEIYRFITTANEETFADIDFRVPSWKASVDGQTASGMLKKLKDNIGILQNRDFLSITPKLEDIALVNRWIQMFNVPHYYLQVFFDKGYIISFEDILSLSSNVDRENIDYKIGDDPKNQHKITIKINVELSCPIMEKIDMPEHYSERKDLAKGRLLFYVKFKGGQGYMDANIFRKVLSNDR